MRAERAFKTNSPALWMPDLIRGIVLHVPVASFLGLAKFKRLRGSKKSSSFTIFPLNVYHFVIILRVIL